MIERATLPPTANRLDEPAWMREHFEKLLAEAATIENPYKRRFREIEIDLERSNLRCSFLEGEAHVR